MPDDMDYNAGSIVDATSLEEAGDGLIEYLTAIANGQQSAPEKTNTELLAVHTRGPAL
jgi:altronate dehydratase